MVLTFGEEKKPLSKRELNRNRRAWIFLLRNGNLPQGSGRLGSFDDGFCALGVACVAYEDQTQSTLPRMGGRFFGWALPGDVLSWLGLPDNYHMRSVEAMVVELNDEEGWTFLQIADWLEKEWGMRSPVHILPGEPAGRIECDV